MPPLGTRSGSAARAGTRLLLLCAALGSACVIRVHPHAVPAAVVVTEAPPPEPAELVSPSPGPEHVWVRGYWSWSERGWLWVPGRWQRARRGFDWVPGRWGRHVHGWTWVPGHWRRR